MGVAALILGIIGLILSVIPGLQTWGLILGLVALILGAVGKKYFTEYKLKRILRTGADIHHCLEP